jgi:hypothetical protein
MVILGAAAQWDYTSSSKVLGWTDPQDHKYKREMVNGFQKSKLKKLKTGKQALRPNTFYFFIFIFWWYRGLNSGLYTE